MDQNKKEDHSVDRQEAYPRPSETDKQLQNQPEYIDQQPNDFHDKSVSDIPGGAADRTADEPPRGGE